MIEIESFENKKHRIINIDINKLSMVNKIIPRNCCDALNCKINRTATSLQDSAATCLHKHKNQQNYY